jgi:hypothetical protein
MPVTVLQQDWSTKVDFDASYAGRRGRPTWITAQCPYGHSAEHETSIRTEINHRRGPETTRRYVDDAAYRTLSVPAARTLPPRGPLVLLLSMVLRA